MRLLSTLPGSESDRAGGTDGVSDQTYVRRGLAVLPLGDGLGAQLQRFGQVPLAEPHLLAALADALANFGNVHGGIVRRPAAAVNDAMVVFAVMSQAAEATDRVRGRVSGASRAKGIMAAMAMPAATSRADWAPATWATKPSSAGPIT